MRRVHGTHGRASLIALVIVCGILALAGGLGLPLLAGDDGVSFPSTPTVEQPDPQVLLDLLVTDGTAPLGGVKVRATTSGDVDFVGVTDNDGHVRLDVDKGAVLHVEASLDDDALIGASAAFPSHVRVVAATLALDAREAKAHLVIQPADGSPAPVVTSDFVELALTDNGVGMAADMHPVLGGSRARLRNKFTVRRETGSDEPEAADSGTRRLDLGGGATGRLREGDVFAPPDGGGLADNDGHVMSAPVDTDSCASPISVANGTSLDASIGIVADTDFYSIALACGDTLRVDVTPLSKELAALVDIYGPSDSTCATILSGGTAGTFGNGLQTTLLRTINTAGTYKVRVRGNAALGLALGTWGPYHLDVKVTAGACTPPTDSFETDSCTSGLRPLTNNLVESREINPATDQDFYNFQWNCGDMFRLCVTPNNATLVPKIELFAPGTNCTGTAAITSTGTAGNPLTMAVVSLSPTNNGVWAVRISSNGGTTSGPYRLSFTIQSTNLCVNDAFEPDDTQAQARTLPINARETHQAVFTSLGALEEDWFKTTLTCGDRLYVRTLGGGPRDVATTVQVRDPSGSVILTSDSTGGGSSFSLADITVRDSGTYFVRVTGASIGAYDITAERRDGKKPLVVPVAQVDRGTCTELTASAKTPTVTYVSSNGTNALLDISGMSGIERHSVGDDSGRGAPIKFDFQFYEDVHSWLTAASNGYLTFGNNSTAFTNQCPIPSTTTPNDDISPMWDDWAPEGFGQLITTTLGTAPNRQFVATWDEVPQFGSTTGRHTFQAILNETTNVVEYRYGVLTGYAGSNGSSATVGVEDKGGTRATSVACNVAGGTTEGVSRTLTPMTSLSNYPPATGYTLALSTGASFLDISTMGGVNLNLTDESFTNGIAMGFTFNYYCSPFSTINVSSNGWASFNTITSATFTNPCPMVSTATPNNTVAPFWDDMNPSGANNVYRLLQGSSPNRQFILMWKNVPLFSGGGSFNFEMIFNESSNTIEFRYGTSSGSPSPSIGVENSGGTDGVQVSCSTTAVPVIPSGTQFKFTPVCTPPPITYTWRDPTSGAVLGTGSVICIPKGGICKVQLETTVSDPGTLCSFTKIQSEDLPCNRAPSANAGGPYSTTCSDAIADKATASDPDGDALTFQWSGPSDVSFSPASGNLPAGTGTKNVPPTTVTLDASVAPCGQVRRITLTVTDPFGAKASSDADVTFNDNIKPTLVNVPADASVECDSVPAVPTDVMANDNCDKNPTLTFSETTTGGTCPDAYTIERTWTATDRCSNSTSATQTIVVVDTQAPKTFAALMPLPPNPPASPAPPFSICAGIPSKHGFEVTASVSDNCDAAPTITAELLVTNHDVVGKDKNAVCKARLDGVSVSIGEAIDIHLIAPPCRLHPPKAAQVPVSVNSLGVKVVTGEKVVLRVTATDECGNTSSAEWDPAVEPSTLVPCEHPLLDGTCCPAIAPEKDRKCEEPLCGR